MKKLILWIAMIALSAGRLICAQSPGQVTAQPGNLAGILYASSFGQWQVPQGNQGQFSWSSSTFCNANANGFYLNPVFAIGTPIFIKDQVVAKSEIVIPSAVTIGSFGCSITVSPVNSHNTFTLQSGTAGLQEAINFANGLPYQVILTPDWTRLGGTTAMITAAKGNSNVTIFDQRTSVLAPYVWNGSAYALTSFGGSACNPNTIPNGCTGTTSFIPYAPVVGGTTGTNHLQSVASAGTAGQPLLSGGASALPAYGTLGFPGGGTGATTAAGAWAGITAGGAQTGSGTSQLNTLPGSFAAGGVTLPSGYPAGTIGGATFYNPFQDFNVLAFGAQEYPAADASAGIQAAINAACVTPPPSGVSGAYVDFPKGTFQIANPINIPCSYITLRGMGTVLQFTSHANPMYAVLVTPDASREQVHFEGIQFRGPGTDASFGIILSNGLALHLPATATATAYSYSAGVLTVTAANTLLAGDYFTLEAGPSDALYALNGQNFFVSATGLSGSSFQFPETAVTGSGSTTAKAVGIWMNATNIPVAPTIVTFKNCGFGYFGFNVTGTFTQGAGIVIPFNSSSRQINIESNNFSGLYNAVEIHGNIDGFTSHKNMYSSILNWAHISDNTEAGASTTIEHETWAYATYGGVEVNWPGGIYTIGPDNEFDPAGGNSVATAVQINDCLKCTITTNSLNVDTDAAYDIVIGNGVHNAVVENNTLTSFLTSGISVGTSGNGPGCNLFINNTTLGTGPIYNAAIPNCAPNPEPENYALYDQVLTNGVWIANQTDGALAPTVTSCPGCTDPNGNTGTGVYNIVFSLNGHTFPTLGYSFFYQTLSPPGGATAGVRQVWMKSNSGTPRVLLYAGNAGCALAPFVSLTWTLYSVYCPVSNVNDELLLETLVDVGSPYPNIANVQVWDPCATYNNGQCQSPAGLPVVTTSTAIDMTTLTNVNGGVVFGSSFVGSPVKVTTTDGTGATAVTIVPAGHIATGELGSGTPAAGKYVDGAAGAWTALPLTTGTPTVNQAACIKAAGPPVVIGYCSTVVGAGGACTCN
jgi:hypothetical protein